MPRSMEEAKAQLAEIKIKKSELSLAKKDVMEQMRQRRAEYTDTVRDRSTAGKGVGALVSKEFGKTRRKAASVQNSYARKDLANDLEPMERQRAEIEAAIAKLDQQKLQVDKWVTEHKAAAQTAKAAPAPAAAKKSKPAPTPAAAESRQQAPAAPAPAPSDERIASLKELASLKESGVLTEEEFQAEKKRILAGN